MKPTNSKTILPSVCVLVFAGALLVQIAPPGESRATVRASAQQLMSADEPLESFRGELLDLAFDAASAMPLVPHVKNRSRAQERVVETCLELGAPGRALSWSERIEGWRRGSALADIAWRCAKRGEAAASRELLTSAVAVAEALQGDSVQDWHRDRIRAKAARAYLELGDSGRAAEVSTGIVGSERTWVDAASARRVAPESLDTELAALEAAVATGDFDRVRGALAAYIELFGAFYADAGIRDRIEGRIEAAWARQPLQVRIEVAHELAGLALERDDRAKALALARRAEELVRASPWSAEAEVAFVAGLAGLRARAGDLEGGRKLANEALGRYGAARERIVDIDRAGALRPLAEASAALGDAAAARTLYARAIEEGLVNPNSRPRAEDLAATCASMALHGVEPDTELWKRLREARNRLGEPW